MTAEQEPTTSLYSANFVFVCPNCKKQMMQTIGRKQFMYTCQWCEKQFNVRISITATDTDGNTYGDDLESTKDPSFPD